MRPVLFEVGGLSVGAYPWFMVLAIVAAYAVRRAEKRRLGVLGDPRHRWVGLGALLGAVVGSKLGMLLFEPAGDVVEIFRHMLSLDFSGKTVVGGLAGGYLGVELAKKAVGVRVSTGDGFAVALPVAQGIGRIGCFFHGCCWGTETHGWWAVTLHHAERHPVQLYEAALDLLLAAGLWSLRHRPWPAGRLFRLYLVGYAAIRFGLDFVRGDPARYLAGLTYVQWVCAATMLGFGALILRSDANAARG